MDMIGRSLPLALVVLLSSPWPAFPVDKAAPELEMGNGRFPGYSTLAAGPWQPRLLPGRNEFTFSMYGCPGSLDELKQLVSVMRERGLGNGFDPGPAAFASSRPLFEYLATVG
jgi:hypothetical protein